MKVNTDKILSLKGTDAAQAPKIGNSEPPTTQRIDTHKLLTLKGSASARAPKIGASEPPTAVDTSDRTR
ncbi:hypothetical protein [Tropicibacter sp. S64]|uniref:hypothetical protein n=1 Tax=Tropicibacter sp. S64 TaxID=3415122 RepID=UPI003C7DE626